MREWCEECGEFRPVMVGFSGDIYCIRCDSPLNAAARRSNYAPFSGWDNYLTVVWGQARRVIIATDQNGVSPWFRRVIDVYNLQRYVVPTAHVHFTYA